MFCREQVARFGKHHARFLAAGASLIAIGNGTPLMAADFVETFSVPFPVFTDPGRSSYKLAGLKRSFGLGIASVGRARRAMAGGHRQGRTQGDPWQQGGVLIIDTSGSVRWHHVDSSAGDHCSVASVLDALRTIV